MVSNDLERPLTQCFPHMAFYNTQFEQSFPTLNSEYTWLTLMHKDVHLHYTTSTPPVDKPLPLKLADLDQVMITCSPRDTLRIPDSFYRFFTRPEVIRQIPSIHANTFNLHPDEVILCGPSFAQGNGGALLRFYTDNQHRYAWYLYLDERGRHCILGSSSDLRETLRFQDRTGKRLLAGREIPKTTYILPRQAEPTFHLWTLDFKNFIFLVWASNTALYKRLLRLPLTDLEHRHYERYRHVWRGWLGMEFADF